MKNYTNQVLSILVTFIVTLGLNVGLEMFTADTAELEFGFIQLKSGEELTRLRITNYSSRRIDGLEIIAPREIEVGAISSTNPVQIQPSTIGVTNADLQVLKVSIIPPRSVTEMFFPAKSKEVCCRATNLKNLNISDVSMRKVRSPFSQALIEGVRTALIYAVFFALAVFWYKAHMTVVETKLEKLKEEVDRTRKWAEDSLEKFKDRFSEGERRLARQRSMLLRRLADYKKELEFWRNTIRKALCGYAKGKEMAESLISLITRELGTFGTRGRIEDDYEAIIELAEDAGKVSGE